MTAAEAPPLPHSADQNWGQGRQRVMRAFPQPAQKQNTILCPLLPCRILSKLLKELHQANSSFPPVQREILGADKDRKGKKKVLIG